MKTQAALLLVLLCSLNLSAYSLNNTQSSYMCNKMVLNSQRSSQWVNSNCKIIKDKFEKEITGSNNSEYDPELAVTDALDASPPTSIILEKITFQADNGTILKCVFNSDKKLQICKVMKEAVANK